MRRRVVGTSVKMYPSVGEMKAWLRRSRTLLEGVDAVDLFVLPPAVCLPYARRILKGTHIGFGAQNMHWEERGAFTGEISPVMLKELGVTHVEIGHAERRRYFGETDATVNRKVLAALKHGLTPVICIGEPDPAPGKQVDAFLAGQVRAALAGVEGAGLGSLILAYEPLWAIGQARAASAEYVAARHGRLRELLAEMYGKSLSERVRLIYGGSVSRENAAILLRESPDVDGLFVGRAALDPERFRSIVAAAEAVAERNHL